MNDDHRIVAVVPALDEAETIGDVLDDLDDYVQEVVVVDDGSTDGTPDIARQHGAHVVEHDSNEGYDVSLDDGVSTAVDRGADVVVTFDADGQHQALDVPKVTAPIQAGEAQVVVGRRPKPARVSEWLFSVYGRLRLGVRDPLSGFKAYDANVYRAVGYFDRLSSIGTHLLVAAIKQGYSIAEVDISIADREDEPRFGHLSAELSMMGALYRIVRFDLRTAVTDAKSSSR